MDSLTEIIYPSKKKMLLFLSLYIAGSVLFSVLGYFTGTLKWYWAAPLPVISEQLLDFARGTKIIISYQNLLINSTIWYLAAIILDERGR